MPQETGEIKIPVPYGCIAAKTWGKSDSNCHKILALHGWQDNCGSFDRLIPLLPDSVYVLAPDLPGHGLSSHLPDGCPYSDIAFVMEIKRIVNHLNWSSFSILGHSMGAMLAILYSSIYPQSVVKVISIDIVKPFTFSRDQMADTMRGFVNSFIRLDKKDSIPPVYGHQMVVEKMISAHSRHGKLDEESVQCLLNRGSQVSSDGKGEYFTRDNRIKTIFVQS
ncbi:unnamed protein product [Medioppia subpectinata]|uniref:AB hydrolase-1 domain-containing protein n=1 Tax=Medioppia subpectinata TaxID=1979941 RepID=A0A7R9Q0H2_9ACAR|nr:unnamed protein product [Medioppia subpectinata]CAG2108133.1 unnamed protein product [Medioppia subpectinata]